MPSDRIRPQDILLLLKISAAGQRDWTGFELARELGISPSQVSLGLDRAQRAGLLDHTRRKVLPSRLLEFLLHGVKYVFPAQPGPVCRGFGTSHSAPPLSREIVSRPDDQYVWPHGDGDLRGQAIEPLYPSAPQAAKRDPELYELLALLDAVRVGRARERGLAAKELERRLLGARHAGE